MLNELKTAARNFFYQMKSEGAANDAEVGRIDSSYDANSGSVIKSFYKLNDCVCIITSVNERIRAIADVGSGIKYASFLRNECPDLSTGYLINVKNGVDAGMYEVTNIFSINLVVIEVGIKRVE